MPPLPPIASAMSAALPSRDAFNKFLSQHARLLEIETPLPSAALVVEKFSGREGISELFRFDIDCLSTSVNFELKKLIGEEVTLRLLQVDDSRRTWHGIVTEAAQLGGDGGLARYRVAVEPWLAEARYRQDCRIYQEKNAIELVEAVLGDYPRRRLDIRVSGQTTTNLPKYAITTQYRERDLDFVQRILARDGLSFYFEHDQTQDKGGSGQDDGAQPQSQHTLVIVDSTYAWPACVQENIRFHRLSATEAEDSIHTLSTSRQVQPTAVTVASWDYRNLVAHSAQENTVANSGELPTLEDYSGAGQFRYTKAADAERVAKNRMQAYELATKTVFIEGSARQLDAGRAFNLTEHSDFKAGDNRLLALWVEHEAANNIEPGMRQVIDHPGVEYGSYRNRAALVRAKIPVVPQWRPAPSIVGLHTALVVGVDGEPVSTDRDLRVKIQLPWQRGENPNPGGLNTEKGNAPGNQASGIWVRVSQASAGPNWGANFTPRIGTEVLVEFVEGDGDRPLIVGSLYNGQDDQPFAAGVDSGVNHPGVISGYHTPTLDNSGYNQWLTDDAGGQLRQRVMSSTAATQLNLGYLVQQSANSANRGAWRGEGFELATDGWSCLRGAQGLLISACARPNGASTQLDAAEAKSQLKSAQDLGKALSDSASAQKALKLESHDSGKAVESLIKTIDPAQDGKYEGVIGGQVATKPSGDARSGGDPVERFSKPIILADTPASMLFATPAASTLFAGKTLTAVAKDDAQISVAHTLSNVSGKTTSLYTHSGGIQAIAANGPVSLQAHTDKLEVLADKSVTVTSVNDEIEILAQEKIRLVAANAEVVLDGGNITFRCPNTWSVKGSSHAFTGPASDPANPQALPTGNAAKQSEELLTDGLYKGKYELFKTDNRSFEGYNYEIRSMSGKLLDSGKTDAAGYAKLVTTPQEEPIAAYKSIMRETERITENWQGKLASATARVQAT
jgi:type VI secretion system secreted protein VgrG